ncbi:MAG: PPOX class F420-dependent oxidoreductase [Chloroflexi bacterium]|nr:MAG: PPOX class F420-dependent oxidoreductase [Chloroflexota bacterium]
MKDMTPAEAKTFLMTGTRTGKLATTRSDGRPHVAPIWFVMDGDDLIFNTWHTSVKAQNMRRDPRVSLCVDEETPPFAFVIVEGTVTLTENAPDLVAWATRIGGRYMGADQAEAFGRRNGVPGELLVRLTPTKIIAKKDVAGW